MRSAECPGFMVPMRARKVEVFATHFAVERSRKNVKSLILTVRTGSLTRRLGLAMALVVFGWSLFMLLNQSSAKRRRESVQCVNNMMKLGASARMWANDNG